MINLGRSTVVWAMRHSFVICLCAVLSYAVIAQDEGQADKQAVDKVGEQTYEAQDAIGSNAQRIAITGQKAPLRVPVYPRRDEGDRPLPDGADLRDQYILLDDGSVISMADWVLGALNKSDIGRNFSDLERRLFLGEVARNMLQEGRLLGARPGVPLPAPTPFEEQLPDRPVGIFANRLPYLFRSPEVATIANGIPRDRGIHVFNDSLGTSDPVEISNGKISLLPDPLAVAVNGHREEWQYRGAQLNMLNAFKAKLKREGRAE